MNPKIVAEYVLMTIRAHDGKKAHTHDNVNPSSDPLHLDNGHKREARKDQVGGTVDKETSGNRRIPYQSANRENGQDTSDWIEQGKLFENLCGGGLGGNLMLGVQEYLITQCPQVKVSVQHPPTKEDGLGKEGSRHELLWNGPFRERDNTAAPPVCVRRFDRYTILMSTSTVLLIIVLGVAV